MSERDPPWRLLGLGGLASLCCIGGSAVGGAAVGGAVIGGTALASGGIVGGLGAGVAQVVVTVLTMGIIGLVWWRVSPDLTCKQDC